MKIKNRLSVLLIILGEALLIISFLRFGKELQKEILTLNIIISSVIYLLVFADILFPWVNLKDKTQKQIGLIGVRWFFTAIYVLLSIAAMVLFNKVLEIELMDQVIIQSILFFLLLLGLYFSFSVAHKTHELYEKEKDILTSIEKMRTAINSQRLRAESNEMISSEVHNIIVDLQDNLRYLSPSNLESAHMLEQQFVEETLSLNDLLVDKEPNNERIKNKLKKCNQIFVERKKINSI